MHFQIARAKTEDNFVSHSGGPKKQFDTYEKYSWSRGARLTKMVAVV